MAKAPVAVGSCIVQSNAGAVFSWTVQGTQATKVKAQGQAVLTMPCNIMISGYVMGSFTQTAPVVATIQPTGAKVRGMMQQVILEGDMSSPVTITGMIGQSAGTMVDTFKISNAGQMKVQGS